MTERSGNNEYSRAAVNFFDLRMIISDYFSCDIFLACGKNISLHLVPFGVRALKDQN